MLLECDCRHDPRQRFSSGGFCTRDVSLTPSHVLIIAASVLREQRDYGGGGGGGDAESCRNNAGRLRRVPASVRVGCQLLLITVGPPVVCR